MENGNGPYRLTSPCPNCPFRTDIMQFLTPERIRELERALIRGEFHCHKTVDYYPQNNSNEEDAEPSVEHAAHCAGALILLEKLNMPSQMMRIAERFGMYDHKKLDMKAPVYDSFDEMYEAAVKIAERKKKRRKIT